MSKNKSTVEIPVVFAVLAFCVSSQAALGIFINIILLGLLTKGVKVLS